VVANGAVSNQAFGSMKPNSPSESDADSPAEGVFADISLLAASTPQHHFASPPALPEWPEIGGSSFTDANPWSHWGLNE